MPRQLSTRKFDEARNDVIVYARNLITRWERKDPAGDIEQAVLALEGAIARMDAELSRRSNGSSDE